ncbi:hypothetical protein M8J77_020779 [Diaphorina citri]|nr:hypothetical protein M8J77_018466 [Diaphorina citri]KAI5721437.1 hypothetical protein M8J77_020779 [Diaphorina citri]
MDQGFVECNSTNIPKLDVNMLFEFANKNASGEGAGSSKEQRSARPNYGDKAIGRVQLRRDGSMCTVKGRITPEHRLRATPYKVICVIDEENEEIIDARCEDCPASEGGCKHKIAFLMWIHRRSEEPSPTEIQSYWRKSTLSSAGLAPLLLSSISKRKEREPSCSVGERETFKKKVLEKCPNDMAANVVHRVEANTVDIHKIIQTCSTFNELENEIKNNLHESMILHIEKKTREQSDCPLWHIVRYGRVTASKFYSVAHCKTEDGTLLNSMLGEKVKSTTAMIRGSQLEDEVFKLVKNKLPDMRKCGVFLNKEYPFFAASPDGLGSSYVVEIKCPSTAKAVSQYVDNDVVQPKFNLQIQLQMAICKKQKGFFVVADPGFETNSVFTLVEVKYDHVLIQTYMKKALEYYEKCVFPCLKG